MRLFLDTISDYINYPFPIHEPIKISTLDKDKEGVAIRLIPAPPGERYYKGRTDLIQFQVYVKAKDQRKAIDTIWAINERLTNVPADMIVPADNSFRVLTCDVYTSPNFVEKTAAMEYMYSALYQAEVEKTGG